MMRAAGLSQRGRAGGLSTGFFASRTARSATPLTHLSPKCAKRPSSAHAACFSSVFFSSSLSSSSCFSSERAACFSTASSGIIDRNAYLHTRQPRTVQLWDRHREITPYQQAWEMQQRVNEEVGLGLRQDALILVQHPPVYTMGRRAAEADLQSVRESGCEVHRVERGGDVTHHCPGQLVAYPLLALVHYKKDLHWYLRQLEEVVILVLAHYGLQGERNPEYTGVWVGSAKVAAVGVSVNRWVTMHGFALNVTSDLDGFHRIVPCGIKDPDKSVGSIRSLVAANGGPGQDCPPATVEAVRDLAVHHFEQVFNAQLEDTPSL